MTKAGEVMEYFGSDISSGSLSRMWLLGRVTDVKGNYWQVRYSSDHVNGEYNPIEIVYTGNDAVSPALVPYNKITFDYAERPDKNVAYVGGAKLSSGL